MSTTRVIRFVAAPPDEVYRALIDPEAVQHWMVPNGMTSEVHRFDAREGGEFEISLTYDDPAAAGKPKARPTPSPAASPNWCRGSPWCRWSPSPPRIRPWPAR